MKKRPLDMESIKKAREDLARIARENPHLIDPAGAKWTEEEVAQMILDPAKTAYTMEEAAELFGCHTETIRKAIQCKELKAAKIGRAWSISKIDLEDFYQAKGGGNLFRNDRAVGALGLKSTGEVKLIK
jgi:excisionase family DNA binding protein